MADECWPKSSGQLCALLLELFLKLQYFSCALKISTLLFSLYQYFHIHTWCIRVADCILTLKKTTSNFQLELLFFVFLLFYDHPLPTDTRNFISFSHIRILQLIIRLEQAGSKNLTLILHVYKLK